MDWSNLFRWQEGRRKTGYLKMLLAQWKWILPWDFYLLHYPTGAYVSTHKDDDFPQFRHYRINLVVRQAKRGGRFHCERSIFLSKELKIFRPDYEHSVDPILEGERYVLSFGFLIPKNGWRISYV